MCISEWSSDVCSSDLLNSYLCVCVKASANREKRRRIKIRIGAACPISVAMDEGEEGEGMERAKEMGTIDLKIPHHATSKCQQHTAPLRRLPTRTEERRVGQECARTCRYRLSP